MDWRQLILAVWISLNWPRTLQAGVLITIIVAAAATATIVAGHVLLAGLLGTAAYRAIKRLVRRRTT
jgi:hypothetical protein